MMFDGTTKLIEDILPGDELLGLNGHRVVVVFVDVTELGTRDLIGLNGRTPRMTQDHPVYSAVVDDAAEFTQRLSLGMEPLLFDNVQSALDSRHWPCPEALVVGSSAFWSVDRSDADSTQSTERLLSLERLPGGTLPASTLVYDVVTDIPSYNVDGVFVRSDFPPILAYPQATLLIERLAMLAVHHSSIRAIVVEDTKLAPKPISFDMVAWEFLNALKQYVASNYCSGTAASSSPSESSRSCTDSEPTSSYCSLESTFDSEAAASSTLARMDRETWLQVLLPRYKSFAGRISGDAKLAWAASRLWAVSLPLLQCILRDTAEHHGLGGDLDALSVAQFSEVEKSIVRVARAAWHIADRPPAAPSNQLQCVICNHLYAQ